MVGMPKESAGGLTVAAILCIAAPIVVPPLTPDRNRAMSYYDVPEGDLDTDLGRTIYMEALSDRRGFREDQLGIFDAEIWAEIFKHMGQVARAAPSSPTAPQE